MSEEAFLSPVTHTSRGFAYVEFEDHNGTPCNIQKSSLADDDAIWIGAKDIGLKKFTPYSGWEDQDTRGEPPHGVAFVANNRMHLTRWQVAALLPLLQHFAATGDVVGAPATTPSEAFSAWLKQGPALAAAAGCYVGIRVTEAKAEGQP
jgi:hypothetical protein